MSAKAGGTCWWLLQSSTCGSWLGPRGKLLLLLCRRAVQIPGEFEQPLSLGYPWQDPLHL